MTQFLLVVAVALTVGAVVFGITMLVTGDDRGLRPVEPDGRAVPLPADRPLAEPDLAEVRFDTTLRGYRMAQVDAALQRAAYDIGYKDELVRVLQAEVDALREGRLPDAEVLRRAREAAVAPVQPTSEPPGSAEPTEPAEPTELAEHAEPAELTDRAEPAEPAEPEPPAEVDAAAEPEPPEPATAEVETPAEPAPEPAAGAESEPPEGADASASDSTLSGSR